MFNPTTIYLTDDPALLVLGRPSTLAHWRCQGEGPSYVRLGSRIGYRGSDLNRWLESRVVQPTNRADAA